MVPPSPCLRRPCAGWSRNWPARPRACSSPRCGAKTRYGRSCEAPAVRGRQRCRMHGGASGSGAPRGNRNALKTGLYTREMFAQRQAVQALLRRSRQMLEDLE
ncbi:HGGxSTG domain-containing protein [Microvirga sp. KLBC 81]|uniref:HGGxSTG domain-containing protein n=1 Tax=Microvirga sp. KLBC 81 TaxID=1862707 RepID=UPI002738A4D4|nr:HGGxSTG domain-containing protein [Microvirga sp. KLBC 81]